MDISTNAESTQSSAFDADDKPGVLTIGTQEGIFPRLVEKRRIRIVVVGNGHGVGEEITARVNREVLYEGKEIHIDLR
jgi:alpha-D-xyloside xylohydrolase